MSWGVGVGGQVRETESERGEEEAEKHYNQSFIYLNLWLESNLIFIIKSHSRRLIRISGRLRVLTSTPG